MDLDVKGNLDLISLLKWYTPVLSSKRLVLSFTAKPQFCDVSGDTGPGFPETTCEFRFLFWRLSSSISSP